MNDDHDGICQFGVCWLDGEPSPRAVFYARCNDGYETVLEPKAEPPAEKLQLIQGSNNAAQPVELRRPTPMAQ